MDSYLGLKLKLTLKDGSIASGTVDSINESTQKLSLNEVKFVAKGSRDEVSFPELTILAKNIDDVEIMSPASSTVKTTKSTASKGNNSKNPITNTANNNAYSTKVQTSKGSKSVQHQSPHGTPSVYADKATTFPSGNARKNLPSEEFDFAANLARFDKASEFKKIQADDLVPKADRLVSINSPQRKLGIRESVLEPKEDKRAKDEIMEKFKHLTVTNKSSPLLVEEGSEEDDEITTPEYNKNKRISTATTSNKDAAKGAKHHDNNFTDNTFVDIPMVSSVKYDKFISKLEASGELNLFRSMGALNFAHHLLAELDPSRDLVLLLGVGEASAFLLETIYHLCNHSRLQMGIHAIFAAGAVGSSGKRIELGAAVKAARKKVLSLERLKFTTSLSDILKLNKNVVVFDALGYDGELTENAFKGLADWMRKLLSNSTGYSKPIIYGIESTILKNCPTFSVTSGNSLQLVTSGIARDTITPSLSKSKSILFVDAGFSGKAFAEEFGGPDLLTDIYSQSFVTEIEYS